MVLRASIVPINTTGSKIRLLNHFKVRTIKEHFRLKIDENLKTASFISNLLVFIKKSVQGLSLGMSTTPSRMSFYYSNLPKHNLFK